MNKLNLKYGLIALAGLGFTANVSADDHWTCGDLTFTPEAYAAYEFVDKACLEVVDRDGVDFAKFHSYTYRPFLAKQALRIPQPAQQKRRDRPDDNCHPAYVCCQFTHKILLSRIVQACIARRVQYRIFWPVWLARR